MNRRNFLTLAASTVAVAALPIKAETPMAMQDAMRRAQAKWGQYALIRLKVGDEARAANRPEGEYIVGWRGWNGEHRCSYWYGDSWEDAFDTVESKVYYDPANNPGANS